MPLLCRVCSARGHEFPPQIRRRSTSARPTLRRGSRTPNPLPSLDLTTDQPVHKCPCDTEVSACPTSVHGGTTETWSQPCCPILSTATLPTCRCFVCIGF